MKKVLLSFAIVLSSFFLFNSKIEALSEYSFNITFDNINERFYKIKDLSENFLKTSDFNNFVIYFNKNYSDYYVYFYNFDKDVVVCKSFGGFKCFIQTAVDNYTFSSDSSKLTKAGSTNYPSFDDPNLFLYSSAKVSVDDIKVNFNYGSSSYVINENDNYLPIYDLYLKVSEKELESRLGSLKERGVVSNGKSTVEEIFEDRKRLYEKYADITIVQEGRDIRMIVEDMYKKLTKLI